jgi:hypothetical protein
MPALTRLVAALALFLTCTIHADTIKRWTDTQGRIHYGDTAPADAAVVEVEIDPNHNVHEAPPTPHFTPTAPRKRPVHNDATAARAARERREREEKCADYQEKFDHLRARMRAGYKASQYNRLMEQEASLTRKIKTYCQ